LSTKILVAAHKEYDVPKTGIYMPVWVGSALKSGTVPDGYTRDDTGENISKANPKYCELTALYWGWKNLDADFIGLVHYRRYFGKKKEGPICEEKLSSLLKEGTVIVPKKRHYYIESLKSHYCHTHNPEHLAKTEEILHEKYPDYIDSYNKALSQTWGYMFNMAIMDKKTLNNYCNWLFDILFELEKRLPEEDSKFDSRLYGRVSELLFNCWIRKNNIRVEELPYYNSEKTNWWIKGISFLKAKFFGKKYTQSF